MIWTMFGCLDICDFDVFQMFWIPISILGLGYCPTLCQYIKIHNKNKIATNNIEHEVVVK